MKAKKQSALSRLMKIAGKHKYFSYASCVLAAISAWVALIPFYDVWRIIKEVLEVRPDYSKATHITSYGWQAVGFALLAMVLYIGALMCSHKAAFRVQTNMRIAMMSHVMKLPLGYVETPDRFERSLWIPPQRQRHFWHTTCQIRSYQEQHRSGCLY